MKVMFTRKRGLHGSPRLHADLLDDGREVSEKMVADSMRRQGLIVRRIQRRNGLAGQDKTEPKFPDLCWDFTAGRHNIRWVGEMTEILTGPDGKGFEAVSGDRDRSLQPPVARRRRPGCARTPSWPVRRSRWLWPHAAVSTRSTSPAGVRTRPAGCVSHRPRLDLHGEHVHQAVPPAGGSPIHGPGRFVLRLSVCSYPISQGLGSPGRGALTHAYDWPVGCLGVDLSSFRPGA